MEFSVPQIIFFLSQFISLPFPPCGWNSLLRSNSCTNEIHAISPDFLSQSFDLLFPQQFALALNFFRLIARAELALLTLSVRSMKMLDHSLLKSVNERANSRLDPSLKRQNSPSGLRNSLCAESVSFARIRQSDGKP
jgi:hypothetical protein